MDKLEQFEAKSKEIRSDMSEAKKQTALLEVAVEGITQLNIKTQTKIDNQAKFEKSWRAAKIGAMFVMAAAVLTDVVKLSEDGQVLIDRASNKILEITNAVKGIYE